MPSKYAKELRKIGNKFHFLYLCLTNKCQQKCKICYEPLYNKKNYQVLKFDNKLKNFLYYFKLNGGYYLYLTGGEPFLYPYLRELIEYCSFLKFEIEIVTNGLLLDKFQGILEDPSILTIKLSILGKDKNHDKIVGVKNAFMKVINNIKNLDDSIKSKINVNMTLIKENLNDRNWVNEYFINQLGIKSVSYTINLRLNKTNYERLKDSLLDNSELIEFLSSPEIQNNETNIFNKKCEKTLKDISINYDGYIYPCLSFKYALGNIYNISDFTNIFDTIKRSKFWDFYKNLKIPLCDKCENLETCSICTGENYCENNDASIPSKYTCLIYKKIGVAYKKCINIT